MIKKSINSDSVLQFKIVLNDSTPRVWRRILVPADYTFFALHCAIQSAMGWTDGHLHAFYIGERKGRSRITIEFPHPENDDVLFGETRDERATFVVDYFGTLVKQCMYSYDFGDSWDHTVLFERTLPRDPRKAYPQCVAGANACPPEDCGGVGGYDHLQKVLKDSKHDERADTLEWLGLDSAEEFDPYQFDPADVEFENVKERLIAWNKGFRL